jgi:hypothetical protein
MASQQANVLTATREIIDLLAGGAYAGAVSRCTSSRLSAADLEGVIRDYGRRLVPPPPSAYDAIDVVRIEQRAVPTWSVRMPMWTSEEGRSDLTLELTVALPGPRASVELDDLRVL